MEVFSEKHAAFVAAKAAYGVGSVSYAAVREAYNAMWEADERVSYLSADWDGFGHWAPSCWDRRLPAPLRKQARDIGRNLRRRLEAAWSETHKCRVLFGDGEDDHDPFCLDSKEQHRLLVEAYMRTLPHDDADIVAYRGLRSPKALRPFEMPRPPAPPGEGTSKRARWRRARRMGPAADEEAE